jgi:hypothetical protein
MGMIFLAGGAIGPVMIILNVRKENQRKGAIRARESEWGKEICDLLIVKRIKLEMSKKMVIFGMG